MLQHISTSVFIEAIVLATASYYIVVGLLFYSKEIMTWLRKLMGKSTAVRENDRFYKDKV
jgi:CTP:phosphocholine cytidylyltransferase-like protein